MSIYERYNAHIKNSPNIGELRTRVAKIVSSRNLSPVMNDTKWLELQQAVQSLPFPPAYVCKLVTEDDVPHLAENPDYYGDWNLFYEEGMPVFFNIEWLQIAPRYSRHRGRLVADELLNISADVIAILEENNIPYEAAEGFITIYGYK